MSRNQAGKYTVRIFTDLIDNIEYRLHADYFLGSEYYRFASN